VGTVLTYLSMHLPKTESLVCHFCQSTNVFGFSKTLRSTLKHCTLLNYHFI